MATPSLYLLSTAAIPPELVEEAAQKGIMLEAEAYISIEPVADEALGARIRELGRQPLVAVFTSTNAVETIGETGGRDWMIFCTSGATRQLVADRFGADAIVGTADSAAGLAAQIIRVTPDVAPAGERTFEGTADIPEQSEGDEQEGPWRSRPDEVLSDSSVVGQDRDIKAVYFFCGDQRRDELPDLLKEAGLTVHEVVVYRTLLTPRKTERIYAGIAFFSPSAVESYFSLNTVADGVTLFAIGQTTAAAIQARCTNPVIISDRPGKDALVRTMTDYFQTNNKE
jgi:uroporphyrinogen-III synthase